MATLLQRAQVLAQKKEDQPQRVCIYGDSGTGKTTLALQLASLGYNIHLFDIDVSVQTAFTSVPQQFWGNVNVYDVVDTPDNARAAKLIDKAIRPYNSVTFCNEHGEVNCVKCKGKEFTIFDTNKLTAKDVVVIDGMTGLSKSASNFAVGSGIMGGDMAYFKLEFEHHDKQGMILSNFLQRMKQLPCHVIVITHAAEIKNPNGTKNIQPIGGTRNFAQTVGRDFDHIVYCFLKDNKHRFTSSTTHNSQIIAKSRSNIDVKTAEDFVKLFNTNIIHAAATQVEFSKDDTGGPDTVASPSTSVAVQSTEEAKPADKPVQERTAIVNQPQQTAPVVQAETVVAAQTVETQAEVQAPAQSIAPKSTVATGTMNALQAKLAALKNKS